MTMPTWRDWLAGISLFMGPAATLPGDQPDPSDVIWSSRPVVSAPLADDPACSFLRAEPRAPPWTWSTLSVRRC